MRSRVFAWVVAAGLLCASTLCCAPARAQHGPGGGGPGGPPGGGGMGGFGAPSAGGRMPGGFNPNASPNARRDLPPSPGAGPGNSTMRGGLQLGPPGRFWDDKGFAKNLGLRKDQQKRMDTIFDSNRATLVESYRTLQVEEKRLERLTKEKPLDEGRIFAGIDAVVQARGAVEKALAHMLLQIRGEMDADQVARMEKFRDEPGPENQ